LGDLPMGLDAGRKESYSSAVRARFQPRSFTFRTTDAAGKPLCVIRTEVPTIQDGKLIRYWGMTRDITDLTLAEDALRESEDRYRDLVEYSQDLICTHDLEGRILSINEAPARSLGYERSKLLKMRVQDILAPEVREEFSEYMAVLLRDGAAKGLMLVQTATGERRILTYNNTLRTEGVPAPIVRAMAYDVTERKRAQKALRESEARLKVIFDSVQTGIFIIDPETHRIVDANPVALWTVGATRDRVVGAQCYKFICPAEEGFCAATDLGQVVDNSECVLLTVNGERRAILKNVVSVSIAGRKHLLESFIDITERKQAEEALHESEERFRTLVENATVGIYRTTPNGRILMANPALVKMMGFDSLEELARRNLEEEGFEPNYPRSEFKAQLEREGEIRGLEEAWIRRDGTTIFVRESARAKRGPNGDVLYYDGIVENITERRRAEESRRYLASIVESSDDAILGTSCEGVIQSWNRGAERLYGYTTAEMIGQPVSVLAPRDRSGEMGSLRDRLSRGEDIQRYEAVRVRKDGSQVDVSTTFSTIKDARGRVIGASIIAHDITKQKRAQQELEHSFEQLRALAARLQNVREEERKLLAREIHDQLGQALTAIKIDLFAWVCEIGGNPRHPSQRASTLLRLVDDALKRVRRIATELRPGVLDDLGLVAAIEWAGEDFEARTGIKCRFDLPQGNIAINPERATAIFRILQESLTNVVRHAAASEVKIRLGKRDKELILLVQDNGKGMRMDKLSRIRSLGILGMRERALVFGGKVIIRATPGKGTTVRVRIPQACLT